MAQFDIVGNLILKVDNAEAGVNRLRSSLSQLKLPSNIDADLKKSFSNLDGLFAKYKAQLKDGFKTKNDVSAFTKTAKEVSAEYDKITKKISQLNSTNVTLNVKSDSLKATEKSLNDLLAKKDQFLKEVQGSIKGNLDNLTKAGSRSVNAKDLTSQINTAISNGEMEKAAELAERLKEKMISLKSAQESWSKTGSSLTLTGALDKVIEDCRRGADGLNVLEKETNDVAKVFANLQAGDLEKINQILGESAGAWEKNTSAMKAASGEAQEYARASQSMTQQLGDLRQSTQYFFSLRNMINLLRRGIDQAIDTVKELDAAMTETAVVTDFSVGDMWTKLPEYTANANALGASVKDMYKATTLYYQQGLNTDQAMGIANETMKMARIGGLEAADATDKMTAALRGFNMELNETSAQRVNDVYSNLAAKTASNTEELGTAMQRTASIAASAGMSFEGTAAFLAQAIETTREPAENLGTAMKTIVARFTELKKNPLEIAEVDGEEVDYNKVDTALKSIGVSLKDANGQFRNLDQVFLDISQRWDSLTQTQQRYVATTAAGSRQQSRFIAMMSNYDRTVQLMDYANNSAGASNEQFGKTMESLEAKLNQLKNAWDRFLMGITNSSFIKAGVDGLTSIIGVINNLIDKLSLGSGGIKSFLSVLTAFTGLRMGGNIINRLIGGLGGLVDPASTFGRGFLGGAGSSRQAANLAQAKATSDPIVAAIRAGVQALGKDFSNTNNTNNSRNIGNNLNWEGLNRARKEFAGKIKTQGKIGNALNSLDGLTPEQQSYVLNSNKSGINILNRSVADWFSNKSLQKETGELGHQIMTSFTNGLAAGKLTSKQVSEYLQLGDIAKIAKEAGPEAGQAYTQAVKAELANNETAIYKQAEELWHSKALQDPDYTLSKAVTDSKREWISKWKKGLEEEDLNNIIIPELTDSEKMAKGLSKVGGAAASAGQAFSTFGMILSNLGLDAVGSGFMALGSTITNVGMTVANLGPTIMDAAASIKKFGGGLKGIKGAVADAGLSGALGVAGTVAAGAAVLGIWLAYWERQEKLAKEAGEKVRKEFEEGYTKKEEQITSLESSKDRFKELAEGVDQYGNNINLTTEEYSEYLSLSREIADLAPSLIAGYDAEGNAILRKGAAIDEVIGKLKDEKKAALDAYTSNTSINKLVGEYKQSDAYKDNRGTKARGKASGHTSFNEQREDLNSAITYATGWTNFSDIMKDMGLGEALNVEDLSNTQLVALSQHYDDVIGVIKEKNPQLKEATESQLRDAFVDIDGAINDVLAEGEPLTSALEQWMGQEKLDAAGLNLSDEFVTGFNDGLKGIELTGLTEGWQANEFKNELRNYSNEWRNLTGPTSEYTTILKDAKKVQDEYLDDMGSDTAIQNYNKNITESCDKLIDLANNTDTATAAGQAFQQQCIAQANALRNYATEGGESLSEALNTAVDDIERAESALENFNEATKTDLFTAAEGMKSIYEKAFETYTDSYGGEYEKHFEGKGDKTAWEAGRSILDEDVLKSIPDGQALRNRMKEWEPALREGEEGWYEFKEKIINNQDIQKALKDLEDEGVELDKSGFLSHIPEDQWANVAKAIGISEEMLTSMLNKGRQFADIDFTNWSETRHTLETSESAIKGVSPNGKGQRALFVKESSFEASLAEANYTKEEYADKKKEAKEEQNINMLKAAEEYKDAAQLQKQAFDKIGINDLQSLVSTLYSTGDFTKDEIEDYAEKAGYQGNFDAIYDSIAAANENPELYKQTSVLEKISSQIALLDDEDISAKDASDARKEWAEKLYGKVGTEGNRIKDSEADYFAHGEDKEGKKLTAEEYEATKKSLEAQQAWAEQQANLAETRASQYDPNSDEAKAWTQVAEQYKKDAENIGTYLTKGAEAFQTSSQEKDALVQAATQKAVDLNKEGASNEEIKTAMVESAQKMADAQMKPEEIAAAINQSYGTNLTKDDVTTDKNGNVDLTIKDESKLQEQLDNLTANITGNITDITFNGAALASGQNNPNSVFHRYGTMARGSHKGYTISGRPTLTGEEGEELVWEPKRNQAYMVGSNGPQFANISKDAVVWNAEQTKRIKKNSKTNNIGTGARGIYRFGTMAGGRIGAGGSSGGGGLKIPGVLNIDATAEIQDVTPPTEEPTIPVKADLQVEGNSGGLLSKIFGGGEEGPSINVAANVTTINAGGQPQTIDVVGNISRVENSSTISNIDATATVTSVTKASQVAGEPISVKATATTTQIKNDVKTPQVSTGAQTINVTANTSSAQAKINQLISLFNKTYTLKYTASGPSSISVPISANFTGSWQKTVTINKSGAKGINNHIGYYSMPSFGSAARGKYGTVGPKNNGGLTLTGEKGFEIAWLPSENRSMILGTQGPQMLSLPSDVVIYNHEQSKKILKQQTIPAGSAPGGTQADVKYKTTRYDKSGGGNGSGKNKDKKKKKHKGTGSSKDESNVAAISNIIVWWDNITRRADAVQRKADKNQKTYEKYLKEIRATLKKTGTEGGGNAFINNTTKALNLYQQQLNRANAELTNLDKGTTAQQKKQKNANLAAFNAEQGGAVQISYTQKTGKKKNKSKSVNKIIATAGYIKEQDGSYVIDQDALNRISNKEERKALADALNKEINDRISKRNSAQDNIEKAQEAIDKFGEELYDTFFKWEIELTKIWNITQKIEATEARIGRAKGYSELLTSQLSTGMAQAGRDFSKQTLAAFKVGINNQRKEIEQTISSIGAKRDNLSKLLSLDDEKATLESIQNKLINDIKYDAELKKAVEKENNAKKALDKATQGSKTTTTTTNNSKVSKISSTLKKGSKGNDVKTLQQALNQVLGTKLAVDGKFGKKTQAVVKQFQKKYGLSVDGVVGKQTLKKLASLTGTKKTTTTTTNQAAIKAAQEAYDKAVADREAIEKRNESLNDTQKLGYETYAENLEKQINAQAEAWKYLSVQRRADGTIDLTFNTDAFAAEQQAGNISEELGKSIQDYVKELVEQSKDLSEDYEKTVSQMNDMYNSLEDLQGQWSDYANELWDMSEEQTKKEIDNAKKLSDSLTKAMKNLLDDVKKKLDERRQREDNVKTERDISQKQQRLAALRADTSGGNQVEIAKLESELADAQQNYQRTLEDQLLQKLQDQADLASEQRERQIEIQEFIAEAVNNATQVDTWMAIMSNPNSTEEQIAATTAEIWEAYKTKNDYDKKPQAIQEELLNKFNVMVDGLLNNKQEQEYVKEQIEVLQEQKEYLETIQETIDSLAVNASTTEVNGGSGVTEGSTKDAVKAEQDRINAENAKTTTTATTPKKTTSTSYGKVSAVSGDLKKGSKGNGVKALQYALNQLIGAKLAIDGDFGKKTQEAVKNFQKRYGLKADGVVGKITKRKFQALGYKTGGLADYTGPAWLDGTPSKPELVLNAKDTKNFLALKDVLSKAMSSTGAVENTYGGDAMYEININVDKIEKDYDVDRVIEKVKKEITKGAGYRNVTQVRNFR